MIREYRSDDLDSFWEIYQNCFEFPLPFWRFRDAVERGRTYILELTSRFNDHTSIKGFVISFIDINEPWIWSIGVNRSYRQFGFGASLLKKVEDYYKNLSYKNINLFVEPNNPAQKLYFDQGYRVRSVETGIYEVGGAIKMVKEL
jgi:ribosomal protein S18 acetylase RimI-like enzyme